MRVARRTIPVQPITHLWERHREIARRLIAGERQIDIATSMGITQSRLSIICNSPVFKDLLQDLSTKSNERAIDVQQRLREESKEAVEVLSKILRADKEVGSVSPALRAGVAKDILDRAGHGKVQKIHQINENIYLTGDRIAQLKAKKAALLNGITVIDVPSGG